MSYLRIIPRDLFNEANLLKVYGQLSLKIHDLGMAPHMYFDHVDPTEPFQIVQGSDGELSIANLVLMMNRTKVDLHRPLNSRDPYPLYAEYESSFFQVFDDDGSFHLDFIKLMALTGVVHK